MKRYIRSSSERKFRDTESGEVITISQLKAEYEDLRDSGETEAETFSDYLANCLDKNGFLEEITASAANKYIRSSSSSIYEIATIYSGPFGSEPSEFDVIATTLGDAPDGEVGHYNNLQKALDTLKSSPYSGDGSWVEEDKRGYHGYVTVIRQGENVFYYKGYDGKVYKMMDELPD